MSSRRSTRRRTAPVEPARPSCSLLDLPGSFLASLADACSSSSRLALRQTCRCLQDVVDSCNCSTLVLRLHSRKPTLLRLQQHGLLESVAVLDTATAGKGTVSIGCAAPFPGLAGSLPRLTTARLNNSQASLVDMLLLAAPRLATISLAVSSATPHVVRQLAGLAQLTSLTLALAHPAWMKAAAGLGELQQLEQLVIAGHPLDEASKHGTGSISSAFWEDCVAPLTRLTRLAVNPWVKSHPGPGTITYSSLVNLRQLSVPYGSGKTAPNGTADLLQQLAAAGGSVTSLTLGVHEFGWDVSGLGRLTGLVELELHNPFLKETWGLQPTTAAHLAPLTAATALTALTISTLRLPSTVELLHAAQAQQQAQGLGLGQPALQQQLQQQLQQLVGLLGPGINLAAAAAAANNAQQGGGGPIGLADALQQAGGAGAGVGLVNAVVGAAQQAAANPALLDQPPANNPAAIAAVQAAAAAVAALAAPLAAMLQQQQHQQQLPQGAAGQGGAQAAAAAAAAAEAQAAAAVQAAAAQALAAQQVGLALEAAAAMDGALLPGPQQHAELMAAAIAAVEQAGHAVAAAVAPVVVAAGGFLPAAVQQQLQQQQQAAAAAAPPPAVAAAAAGPGAAGGGGGFVAVPLVAPLPPAAVAAAAAAAAGAVLPQLPCLTSLRRLTVGTTHGRLSSGVSLAAFAPNLTCFEDLSELTRLPPAGTDMLCGLTNLQLLTVNVDTLQQHARHPSLAGFTALSSSSGTGGSSSAPAAAAAPSAAAAAVPAAGASSSGVVRLQSLPQLGCLRLLMLGHVHAEVIPGGCCLPLLPGITRLELASGFGGCANYADTYTIAEDPLLWQEQVAVEELVVDGGVLLGGFLVDAGMAALAARRLARLRTLELRRCPDLTLDHLAAAVAARLAPTIIVSRDCPLVSEAGVAAINAAAAAAGGGVSVVLADPGRCGAYRDKSLTYAIDE